MVVKMKKLELLLFYKEKEQFLDSLRTLGVVHIVEDKEKLETSQIQKLQSDLKLCERVQRKLSIISSDLKTGTDFKSVQTDAVTLINKFESLEEEREKVNQEITALKKDLQALEPWGQFEPDSIKKLALSGVKIRFLAVSLKKFESIDTNNLPIKEIGRLNGQVYFVLVERGDRIEIDAEEVRLPEFSINEINQRISQFEKKGKEIDNELALMISAREIIRKYSVEVSNQLQYEKARESMYDQAEGKLLHMTGWFPIDREEKLKKYFDKHAVYYSVRDPLPDDDIPVKLKNDKFSKLYEPITGIYSLPHYLELDTTPFIAPFFTIFFGLCLGDVGYGLILLIAALIAGPKVKPNLKPIISLVTILALTTMVSGVLLNSFFGLSIFGGDGVSGGFFSSGVEKFSPLSPVTKGNNQVFPAMSLAIVLGFVQLLFGMGLKSYVGMKNSGFASGIQPIASMMMIAGGVVWAAHVNLLNLGIPEFSVGPLLIGKVLVTVPVIVAKVLVYLGLALFLLFNNVDKKIFVRPLIGLYEFYNFASGLLGNILSYLRLFALGLAGGLLGAAFNQIAFLMITRPDGTINYASAGMIGTVIVLILGHSLNLFLSLIGSFVHPLRLTLVEFYGAIGFKGGSKPYKPFSKEE